MSSLDVELRNWSNKYCRYIDLCDLASNVDPSKSDISTAVGGKTNEHRSRFSQASLSPIHKIERRQGRFLALLWFASIHNPKRTFGHELASKSPGLQFSCRLLPTSSLPIGPSSVSSLSVFFVPVKKRSIKTYGLSGDIHVWKTVFFLLFNHTCRAL